LDDKEVRMKRFVTTMKLAVVASVFSLGVASTASAGKIMSL